jgi:hypothetical protein
VGGSMPREVVEGPREKRGPYARRKEIFAVA